jgi:hypothetical protein
MGVSRASLCMFAEPSGEWVGGFATPSFTCYGSVNTPLCNNMEFRSIESPRTGIGGVRARRDVIAPQTRRPDRAKCRPGVRWYQCGGAMLHPKPWDARVA